MNGEFSANSSTFDVFLCFGKLFHYIQYITMCTNGIVFFFSSAYVSLFLCNASLVVFCLCSYCFPLV